MSSPKTTVAKRSIPSAVSMIGKQPPQRSIAIILAALTAFAPLSTDMYLASFPKLAERFATSVGEIQLSLSLFLLGLSVGQLLYGPLIDRYGRKIPLLTGTALFAVISLAIIFAPNAESFILLRILQAVGGCAGMIISRAIISDLYEEREAARMLSLIMAIQALAPITAPVMGGYLIAAAGWQAIFALLAGFGLVCLLATGLVVPETLPVTERRKEGIGQTIAAYGCLMSERSFLIPALVSSLSFAVVFAFISGSPLIYMTLYGVSGQIYGWLFALNAVGIIIGAAINSLVLRRFSSRQATAAALCTCLAATAALTAFGADAPLPLLVGLFFICSATVPVIGANTVAFAVAASGDHRGGGSAIIGVMQFGIAGAAATAVGLLSDGSIFPVVGTMLIGASLAALAWFLTGRKYLTVGTADNR